MSIFRSAVSIPAEVLAGENIRKLRQRRALELHTLAQLTGLTQEQLSGIEAGQPGLLCLDDLDRLASALDVRPASLFVVPGDETISTVVKA